MPKHVGAWVSNKGVHSVGQLYSQPVLLNTTDDDPADLPMVQEKMPAP
jgi:hypothetical protein